MTGADEAAARLLADLRVEVARADSKAALLVGALGMTAGVLGGQLSGPHRPLGALSASGLALWWSGTAALFLALVALLLAVLPRALRSGWQAGTPLAFFGDIRTAEREGRLAEALTDTAQDPGTALRAALAANSRIALRKHQWIRIGLLAYGSGVLLLPAALFLG
ncbi:Pycsar system effector family protein [Streptomyces sp. NPDC051815]|uniref:Pycsar system effector family protein n=1 Tax=Streptomyces sp. NPDC051815 TaxID=3365674 RepID=UPI0037AD9C99